MNKPSKQSQSRKIKKPSIPLNAPKISFGFLQLFRRVSPLRSLDGNACGIVVEQFLASGAFFGKPPGATADRNRPVFDSRHAYFFWRFSWWMRGRGGCGVGREVEEEEEKVEKNELNFFIFFLHKGALAPLSSLRCPSFRSSSSRRGRRIGSRVTGCRFLVLRLLPFLPPPPPPLPPPLLALAVAQQQIRVVLYSGSVGRELRSSKSSGNSYRSLALPR